MIDNDPPIAMERQKTLASTMIGLTDDLHELTGEEEERIVIGEVHTRSQLKMEHSAKIYRKGKASRKEPYLDLLIAHQSETTQRLSGGQGLHQGGFATIYKLMAGETVECPLCLEVMIFFFMT